MPAKSKAQQAYMAIAEHHPDQLRGPMPQMDKQDLHDFAATKTKKLPSHVLPRDHTGGDILRKLAGQA